MTALVRAAAGVLVAAILLAGCGRSATPPATSTTPLATSTTPSAATSATPPSSPTAVGSAGPSAAASGASPSTAPVPSATSAVMRGTVSAGPTCPVERLGSPCPPRPLSVQIDALDPSGHVVGSTHSDAAGSFWFSLPPRQYRLHVAAPSVFPRCPDTSLALVAGAAVTATITCDTGIR